MLVKKVEPRELKVIKYDGTNLNAIKQFIEKDCNTKIYYEGKYEDNPYNFYLEIRGYTLFLKIGTYLVQAFNLYGYPEGFYDYASLEELKKDFIIVEKESE